MLKYFIVVAGILAVSATLILLAKPAAPIKGALDKLAEDSVLELPQIAARMVSEAPKTQQAGVAREVLQKVDALAKPGMIPFTVSAICRACPDIADETVRAAAALQPQDVLLIAKAALSAAPARPEIVVEAICRQVPQAYPWVAVMAVEVDPEARGRILKGISLAIPFLVLPIEQAQKYCGDRPMPELMEKVHELATAAYQEEIAQLKRSAIENALQNPDAVSGWGPADADGVAPMPAAMEQGATINSIVRARLGAMDRGVTRELMEAGLIPDTANEMGYLRSRRSIQPDSGITAP